MIIKRFNESSEFNDRIRDLGYIQDAFESSLDELSLDCVYYEFDKNDREHQGYNSDGILCSRGEFQSRNDFIMISGKIHLPNDVKLIQKNIKDISKQIKSAIQIKRVLSHFGVHSLLRRVLEVGSEKIGIVEFYVKFFY